MNYELLENNKVTLKGMVASLPEYSHEVYGEEFFTLFLAVERLSDHQDIIPITVSDRILKENNFEIGAVVALKGQFRSYNKIENEKSKLMLTVFVREVVNALEEDVTNEITLTGYVCKNPVYRTTPFKREICDILVAVNRAYNKSDYLPCIAWGRNARFAKGLNVGDAITLTGRIQSRDYQKKLSEEQTVTKTAYEISISAISTNKENKEIKFDKYYI